MDHTWSQKLLVIFALCVDGILILKLVLGFWLLFAVGLILCSNSVPMRRQVKRFVQLILHVKQQSSSLQLKLRQGCLKMFFSRMSPEYILYIGGYVEINFSDSHTSFVY